MFVVMPCTAVLKHKEKGPVAGWVAGGPARPRYVGAASTSRASGARAAAVNVRTQEAIEVLEVGGPSRAAANQDIVVPSRVAGRAFERPLTGP